MSEVCKTCNEAGYPMPCMGCDEYDEMTEELHSMKG